MQKYKFPQIMGILNVTPDSFSDGGNYINTDIAVAHALKLLDDGAEILDIGGESSRPGALSVSVKEEINRVIPVIKTIKKLRPESVISVDTVKYEVAGQALNEGAEIINDISGLKNDERLAELAAKFNSGLILMHIKGEPRTMQNNPVYNDLVREVFDELSSSINLAKDGGVSSIYADIGIGFGKSYDDNLELLRNIRHFQKLDVPLVLGISRKSFIGKMLNIEKPSDRDTATAIIHALLLKEKIEIIRVHNVAQINQLKTIYESIH